MKKISLFWISVFICIFGILAELNIYNILRFLPYHREVWHLLCFIFGSIFFYFLLIILENIFHKNNNKRNQKINLILTIILMGIVAIPIEISKSTKEVLFFSLEKFGYIIINLIGIGFFLLIYFNFLKKSTIQSRTFKS